MLHPVHVRPRLFDYVPRGVSMLCTFGAIGTIVVAIIGIAGRDEPLFVSGVLAHETFRFMCRFHEVW